AYPTQIGMQLSANLARSDEYTLIEQGRHPGYGAVPNELTTPIPYFTEAPVDYFKTSGFGVTQDMSVDNLPYGHPWMRYTLAHREAGAFVWNPSNLPILTANREEWKSKRWIIVSLGPDHIEDVFSPFNPIWAEYTPTNGTQSAGDISESGP
ncbi:MAG: hypothetical protein KC940_07730, partial [Candidatus Omnitrophica bacterium]|nr:hypothetical protein [Candidatus Omnitrophota bacterium]